MKKKEMKRIGKCTTGILLILCLLLTGCEFGNKDKDGITADDGNADSAYAYDPDMTEAERFEQFSDEKFLEEISENTLDLHYTIAYPEKFGIDDYEVRLSIYKKTDRQEALDELDEMADALDSFSRDSLEKEQQIAYDILKDYVETARDAEELYYYGNIFSAMTGYQTQLPVLLAEYTFRCERDVTDYLEILGQIDASFSSYMIYEKEQADLGLGMPDFALDNAIEVCTEFVKNADDCYLIETFDERIDALEDIPETRKQDYKEKNKELILHDVMDAYKNLADELEGLKGKGTNEAGLCNFPKGKEYYEYLIRTRVGSDMSVDDIKDITETYLDSRIEGMRDLIAEDSELYDMILETDSLTDLEAEEIMPELIEKCKKDFGSLENVSYEIKYVPKAMEEHLNPAFYLTPAIDDTEHNVIYINKKYEDSEDMYPLLAHEGYPGHLYQMVSSAAYDRPLIRNLFSFSGYTEGYATYAELYSYTLADTYQNLAKLMQYDNSFTLAFSAYIDICVNYYGWDVDDVEECLKEYGIGDADTAESVFEMVVEEPAEYLDYFVGFLEVINLRSIAKEELGDKFVLKDFHEFFISVGPAPFYLIEDYLEDWIREQ